MERTINIFPDGKTAFKNPQPIGLDQRDVSLWINTVFGVNREGVLPARFLSGFVSGFGLAETIQKATKDKSKPELRIFIPRNISSFVNGIENSSIDSQIRTGTKQIEGLAVNHFPTVSLFFETDNEVSAETRQVLNQIANLFADDSSDDELVRIRKSGLSRGGKQGEQNALLYAAHHPFGWSDLQSPAIFDKQPPFTVINCLPPSEKVFQDIRKTVFAKLSGSPFANLLCHGKRYDLLMMMSSRPHYLLITDPDGEALEPTTEDLEQSSCGQIISNLEVVNRTEKVPWTKEDLRRAKIDFEKLVKLLAKNGPANFLDLSFAELLKGETR